MNAIGPTSTSMLFLHGAYGHPDDGDVIRAHLKDVFPHRWCSVALPAHGDHLRGRGDDSSRNDGDDGDTDGDGDNDIRTQSLLVDFEARVEEALGFDGCCNGAPSEDDADLVVIAYSMGGRLALWQLLHQPRWQRRLRALVLMGSSPGLPSPTARAERAALDAGRADALVDDPDAFLRAFWALPLFGDLIRSPAAAQLLERRVQDARRDPVALARVMALLSVGRQPNRWPTLPTLTMPTLLLTGSRDLDAVQRHQAMLALLPHGEVDVVEGAGHAVLAEAPLVVAQRIADFLLATFSADAISTTSSSRVTTRSTASVAVAPTSSIREPS